MWKSINNSKNYTLQDTEVSVVFYDRSCDYRGKIITLFNLTRLHHCGIIFRMGDESILLMSDKSHRAKFIDADRFHERFFKPTHTIKLGTTRISVQQITDYFSSPYIGDARSIIAWFFITRWCCKSLQPKTCALLVSQILRLCGFRVKDCVTPKSLYKELSKYATDSNCGTSRSR